MADEKEECGPVYTDGNRNCLTFWFLAGGNSMDTKDMVAMLFFSSIVGIGVFASLIIIT
jgi:hypothetical protein